MLLSDMYKRIVFYGVAVAIVACLIGMLRPVVVSSCNVVIRNAADSITRDHIFNSLDAEGIEIMTLGSIDNEVLYFRIPKSQFEDAKKIVESIAKSSNTIKILGIDKRGDLWVDRGLGEEFSAKSGQAMELATDIPERFRELVVAINHEFPDAEMTNNDLPITWFHVSKRRYLGLSGKYVTGFDVTIDTLRSDQTSVSTTYQLTDDLTNVRIVSAENAE
ncbi:MAG: hypothetical protein JNL67_20595 [Planctomycetaceae bacterium]|nr:hypothetical protein [Planctomycetaceae bacterium]